MRFSIIEREPDYFFDTVRDNLEKLVEESKEGNMFSPLAEIRENESEYTVKLQLAGVNKDDISIELANNTLTVRAEHKLEEVKENENIHMSEFSYGQFVKSVSFEKEIDADNSCSEYTDGILTISLKKKEEKKDDVKKISIK